MAFEEEQGRRADNARRMMERQGGAASRSQGTRAPSQGARVARSQGLPKGASQPPPAPSRRSIPRFGETEKKGRPAFPGPSRIRAMRHVRLLLSSPRRRAPSNHGAVYVYWVPAFAGMTTNYEKYRSKIFR